MVFPYILTLTVYIYYMYTHVTPYPLYVIPRILSVYIFFCHGGMYIHVSECACVCVCVCIRGSVDIQ